MKYLQTELRRKHRITSLKHPAEMKLAGAVRKIWDSPIANASCRPTAFQHIFGCENKSEYSEDFYKPKIVYPNMTKYLPFTLDETGLLTNQKCFIITGNHISFLTAFLNSSLFKYCFRDVFPELQGGTRELSKIFFDKIPIIKVDNKLDNIFHAAIMDIQNDYSNNKARNINKMIFDLYDLSDKESEFIESIESD